MPKFIVQGTYEVLSVHECTAEIDAPSYDAAVAIARRMDHDGSLPWGWSYDCPPGPSVFQASPAGPESGDV